jgi:hypothetical protein
MTSNRLALLRNADGEFWATEFREGDTPKMLVRDGRAFTCLMTCDARYGAMSLLRWACAPNGTAKLSVAPNAAR